MSTSNDVVAIPPEQSTSDTEENEKTEEVAEVAVEQPVPQYVLPPAPNADITDIQAQVDATLSFIDDQIARESQSSQPNEEQTKQLLKFKQEYVSLFSALSTSANTSQTLHSQCTTLIVDLQSNASKLTQANVVSSKDKNTISTLKKDIKKAWKMVESSNEKEQRAKEAIQNLKGEITQLTKVMENGAGNQIGKDHSINALMQAKEDLTRERDSQNTQIVQLRAEVAEIVELNRVIQLEKIQGEQEIQDLKDAISQSKSDAENSLKRKEKLDRELKEARAVIETKSTEIRQRQELANATKEDNTKLEAQLRDQKTALEKAQREQEILSARSAKVQSDYSEQLVATSQLLAENQNRARELKLKTEELNRIQEEVRNISKAKEALTKRIKVLEDGKLEAETARDSLKVMLLGYEYFIPLLTVYTTID